MDFSLSQGPLGSPNPCLGPFPQSGERLTSVIPCAHVRAHTHRLSLLWSAAGWGGDDLTLTESHIFRSCSSLKEVAQGGTWPLGRGELGSRYIPFMSPVFYVS